MKKKAIIPPALLILIPLALLGLGACTAFKSSAPILAQKDYEKMLVGPLNADYVGNDNCLKACHDHDRNALFLKESVHGQQVAVDTGMPPTNCETCHGPGSLAVAHAAENKKCDTTQFVPLKDLPAAARSLLCLKCHSSYSMHNLQFWPGSVHARADVSCTDCHQLHKQANQKLQGEDINRVCAGCHQAIYTQFSLFSRHPLREGKMTCVSCHEPHGSLGGDNLGSADQKSLCAKCHADKTGPFIYEHGDLMDDCGHCHQPHGSPFSGLLKYQEPFLCLECHIGHTENESPRAPATAFKRGIFTRCTSCHTQIHGSDIKGDSTRSNFIY